MTNPTPQPAAPQAGAPLSPADDKQWASFAHFGGLLGFLPSLIIYLIFKDRGALTRQEAKEALNWQITFTIGVVALNILIGIIQVTAGAIDSTGIFVLFGLLLGFLPFLLWVVNAIFSILGGVKVNGGGAYRYPFAIRLIK